MNTETMNIDQGISESQLTQLDELLQSFQNVNNCDATKANGDDDDMILSVEKAANSSHQAESSFLKEMIYIESSYTD